MIDNTAELSSRDTLYRQIKVTPDFSSMIKILFWNSQGFFYFGFIIPLISALYLNASGLQLGWLYSIRVIGGLISLPIAGYLSDHASRLKGRMVLGGAIGRGIAYVMMFAAIQWRSEYSEQVLQKQTLDISTNTITSNLTITTPFTPKPSKESKNHSQEEIKRFWIILSLSMFFTGLILTALNEVVAKPFVQLYLIDNIESNLTLVMLIFFPSEIISMLLAPKLGVYADKLNEFLGIGLTCISGALVTLLLINTSSAWIFAFLLIADATLARLSGLILQNILSRVSPAHRGVLFGLKTWMGHLGEVVGPILGGYLWDVFGQYAPFRASIGIELALIPVFIVAFFMLKPFLEEKKDPKHSL